MDDLSSDFRWVARAVEDGIVPPDPLFVAQTIYRMVIGLSEQLLHLGRRLSFDISADLVERFHGVRSPRAATPKNQQDER